MYLICVLTNIVFLIILTLVGGVLPLIERKYLSLIQRRVGPKFVGYKGRLQFIADALKLFLKQTVSLTKSNKILFFLPPTIVLMSFYVLVIQVYWGRNIILIDIEYNLLFLMIFECFISVGIIFLGYFSKNKYAFIGAIRAVSMVFATELLLGVFYLNIFTWTKSFNLSSLFVLQEEVSGIVFYASVLPGIIILIMLEVNKTPFDLSEAETELVTGYHTEYGGFFFGLYYLGEYLHIFFISNFLVLLLGGV